MRVKALTLVMMLAAFLSGCSEEQRIRIGVCVADGRKTAYAEIKRGMTEEAKRLKVKLIWRDASRRRKNESTVGAERRFIGDMLEEGIDALIWNPATDNPKFAYLIVRRAEEKGVPIVALDGYPKRLKISLLVEPDYVEMGRMAARFAVKKVLEDREKANFIVLEEPFGNERLRRVTLGIYEVLDGYPAVNLLSRIRVRTPAQALGVINALLTRYAGNVQAIVACNDEVIPGTIEALRAHNLLDKTVTVGVGAKRMAIKYLLAEEHDAEIDPMHRERGKLALKMALELAEGRRIAPDEVVEDLGIKLPVKYGPARVLDRRRVYLMREVYPDLWRPSR